jgi:glucan endo-1,3-alpha-glucosidase
MELIFGLRRLSVLALSGISDKKLISCQKWVAALILSVALTTAARSNDDVPLVFAHWIVAMPYEKGEGPIVLLSNDIRAAMELGLDAFALNAFSGPQAKDFFSTFIRAADVVGARNFKFFLSADMSLGFTSQDIVDVVRTFGNDPHYLKIDGKPLLSTFAGQGLGDRWWQDNVLSPLESSGIKVSFVPAFGRPNPNGDTPNDKNWKMVLDRYGSIDGLFDFGIPKSPPFRLNDENIGNHSWSLLDGQESLARTLKQAGKLYMASYTPMYWAVCHPARQYTETQGGRGMENAWASIIGKQHPRMVEIVTWNDYSEATYIQPTRIPITKTAGIPSLPHLGHYELLKYYVAWYKSNRRPTIIRDSLFFFHRTHPNNAVASDEKSGCSLGPIPARQKWGNVQDRIYVTTALTAPAELVVKTGSSIHKLSLSAGLNTVDVPFEPGRPAYELWRAGDKILGLTGDQIIEDPDVYNFNVTSGYSIVGGQNSETWKPSDNWKTGFVAEWFKVE